MPKFDRTGPTGMGQGTGRGFGPCFGFKSGLGRYFRWSWPKSKNDQKKFLADYRKALKEELEYVKKEEEELNKKG
jgi:hypothetical protein